MIIIEIIIIKSLEKGKEKQYLLKTVSDKWLYICDLHRFEALIIGTRFFFLSM